MVTWSFAYSKRYLDFRHDVKQFLDDYVRGKNRDRDLDIEKYRNWLQRIIRFVDEMFPYGFRRSANSLEIPRVRLDAIAMGSHLALESRRMNANLGTFPLDSKDFRIQCRTDASNSNMRLRGLVEFVGDRLVG